MTPGSLFALGIACVCHAAAFDMELHRINKTMAAVYTPMQDDGLSLDLNESLFQNYAYMLARKGITNIMPAGSNGESLSLSVAERKQLAEAWAKVARRWNGTLRVYLHIGSESLVDTRELARHAAATPGISGILAMTPVYFKPTVKTLARFLAKVAEAAPELPFWFYHFPDDTGVLPGAAHQLVEYIDEQHLIPNFMGVKYTDYNLMDFQRCLAAGGGRYNMLYGRDEQAISALQLGADAAVSSTVQFAPSLRQVVELWNKGDVTGALAAQAENAQLCTTFGGDFAHLNVQKNLMKAIGMDVGPSRLPKEDLAATALETYAARLRKAGLLDEGGYELVL